MMPSLTLVAETSEWRNLLKKKGNDLAQIPHNVRIFLENHPHYHGCFRWNRVALRVEVSGGAMAKYEGKYNLDELVAALVDHLASVHDLSVSREEVGKRLVSVAMDNEFDPLVDWLKSLVWDGVPRLDRWLSTYAGAELTEDGYVSFVGRKWLLSVVARAFQPGCKADVVLVAEGEQGAHKSTLFQILGGPWFVEAIGILGDKDSKLLIGTAWIVELPDMAAFSKSDRNTMKAFFTIQTDRYRPPYGKSHLEAPRRAVFAATTNDEAYFADPTGNRRFWPVQMGEIDRAALIRDRDQLFAEAAHVYLQSATCTVCQSMHQVIPNEPARCSPHAWWLTKAEKKVAKLHSQMREQQDSWATAVLKFAEDRQPSVMSGNVTSERLELTIANVLVNALDFKLKDIGRRDEMRVADILRRAGYERPKRGRNEVWELPELKL